MSTRCLRLIHVLYRVALSLVLAMLVLVPVAPCAPAPCLCAPGALALVRAEGLASFSAERLTTIKRE